VSTLSDSNNRLMPECRHCTVSNVRDESDVSYRSVDIVLP
jgi:hypothetical protein